MLKLNAKISEIIKSLGWKGLNSIQRKSFNVIKEGTNTLIMAPTGFGKTEAGLIPILDEMLKINPKPVALLYITPMRALINDIVRRIDFWASRLGFTVARKHGDVPQSEKNRRLRKAPHILVLTPESLKIDLDWASKFRSLYENLRWVIVDEVHEIIGNKRGTQLALLLERLRKTYGIDPQIIGLSATLGSPDKAIELLSGSSRRKKKIIADTYSRPISVIIDHVNTNGKDYWEEVAKKVVKYIEPLSIIFVRSRYGAERLLSELEKLGEKSIMVHHSSVSGELKETIENRMREKKLRAVISTRTLELGIDVGDVNNVIIVGSPSTAYELLQKVGRSGHAADRVPRGVIIATSEVELLESVATAVNALRGEIEPQLPPECPLDVIAREAVGMALSGLSLTPEYLSEIVTGSGVCREFNVEDAEKLLKYIEETGVLKSKNGRYTIGSTFYKIWRFDKNDRKWWSRDFPEFFTLMNDGDYFQVVCENRIIGELDSGFVYKHLRVGDTIRLSGSTWRVVEIDDTLNRIEVVSCGDDQSSIPIWRGGTIPISMLTLERVKELILRGGSIIQEAETRGLRITEEARLKLVNIVNELKGTCSRVIAGDIVIQELGESTVMLTFAGVAANLALAYALLMHLTSTSTLNTTVRVSPYAIAVKPKPSLPEFTEMLRNENEYLEYVKKAVKRTPSFHAKLREIQLSFGKIGKAGGEEDDLLTMEAVKQVIEEELDLLGSWDIVRRLNHAVSGKNCFVPRPLLDDLLSRPEIKPWIRDSSIAILEALRNWAFTEEELSEILMLPKRTISNKLKELRKNGTSVTKFVDVETMEWRWALTDDLKRIAEMDEFKTSFEPIDPSQPFVLEIRTREGSQYSRIIVLPEKLIESHNELLARIPDDVIFEMRVTSPSQHKLIRDMSPRYYYVRKDLVPLLFLNGVAVLQNLENTH